MHAVIADECDDLLGLEEWILAIEDADQAYSLYWMLEFAWVTKDFPMVLYQNLLQPSLLRVCNALRNHMATGALQEQPLIVAWMLRVAPAVPELHAIWEAEDFQNIVSDTVLPMCLCGKMACIDKFDYILHGVLTMCMASILLPLDTAKVKTVQWLLRSLVSVLHPTEGLRKCCLGSATAALKTESVYSGPRYDLIAEVLDLITMTSLELASRVSPVVVPSGAAAIALNVFSLDREPYSFPPGPRYFSEFVHQALGEDCSSMDYIFCSSWPMENEMDDLVRGMTRLSRLRIKGLFTEKEALRMIGHRCCLCCGMEYPPSFEEMLMKCSGCKTAYYCSPECQKLHWTVHKRLCKGLVAHSRRSRSLHSMTKHSVHIHAMHAVVCGISS